MVLEDQRFNQIQGFFKMGKNQYFMQPPIFRWYQKRRRRRRRRRRKRRKRRRRRSFLLSISFLFSFFSFLSFLFAAPVTNSCFPQQPQQRHCFAGITHVRERRANTAAAWQGGGGGGGGRGGGGGGGGGRRPHQIRVGTEKAGVLLLH